MTKYQRSLWDAVGGLTKTSKMPWYSYSLPARLACPGSAERMRSPASVCRVCYGCKGMYVMPDPRKAMARRLRIVERFKGDPRAAYAWAQDMVHLLLSLGANEGGTRFRWHDSGDVTGAEHMEAIAVVARKLPFVRFWLPTQEPGIVNAAYLRWMKTYDKWPENLCVRVGARDVDGEPDTLFPCCEGATYSKVVSSRDEATCPATMKYPTVKACADVECSLCWQRNMPLVKFRRH